MIRNKINLIFLALTVCSGVEVEPIKITSSVQREDPSLPDDSNQAVEPGVRKENGTGAADVAISKIGAGMARLELENEELSSINDVLKTSNLDLIAKQAGLQAKVDDLSAKFKDLQSNAANKAQEAADLAQALAASNEDAKINKHVMKHVLDDARDDAPAKRKRGSEASSSSSEGVPQDAHKGMEPDLFAPIVITTIDTTEGRYPNTREFSQISVEEGLYNGEALFLKDVRVARPDDGVKIFEGTLVDDAIEFQKLIQAVLKENDADQILLYVHGFRTTPSDILKDTAKMNAYYASLKGSKAFVIPVIWPSEPTNYFKQKNIAPSAAVALRSLLPKFNRTMPVSIVCHSMGNFVLTKFAPESGDPIFKFTNIYMVASDVRQTTFDHDDERGDLEGDDILRLVQGEEDEGKFESKVHVLWYWWDMALLGRRALNWGRPALGKNGFKKSKVKPESRLGIVQRECTDFAKTIGGFWGHGYHTTPGALDYYLVSLRDTRPLSKN